MRKALALVSVFVVLFFAAVPSDAAEQPPVLTSDCALNTAEVSGTFGPPVEPVLGGAVLSGYVQVYGNIWCRSVTVTATVRPYFQITPWQYGAPTACVPHPLTVGGVMGACLFNTVQVYYPVGTMLPVDVEAVGVDDLGRPVRRSGSCWLTYWSGQGTSQTCSPW